MDIRVYAPYGQEIIEEYIFPYSDMTISMKKQNNPLTAANETAIYTNRTSGIVTYKLYLNKDQMRQIIRLYAYQEAGYRLKWINNGERSVYIVSDFTQKKVGLKSFVNIYEIEVSLEIVKNDILVSGATYSNDFLGDASDIYEFQEKYPHFGASAVDGSAISVSNSNFYFNSEAWIEEYITGYPYDVFSLKLMDLVYSGGQADDLPFTFALIFNAQSYVSITIKPSGSAGNFAFVYQFKRNGSLSAGTMSLGGYLPETSKITLMFYSERIDADTVVWFVGYILDGEPYYGGLNKNYDAVAYTKDSSAKIHIYSKLASHFDSIIFSPNAIYNEGGMA